MALLGFLQARAWPTAWVELVSPAHGELFRQASHLVGEELAPRLSIAPQVSRQVAVQWLALAALLVAAALVGRHSWHRRVLAAALVATAGFEVLYGMQRWLGGVATIWGRTVPGDAGRLRGTYINPDHFALLLELVLPVLFAWGWYAVHRARRSEPLERRLLYLAPPFLLWPAFFVALAFSGSRAGLVAALAAALVQSLALAMGPERSWRPLLFGFLAVAAGLASVLALGASYGFGRLLGSSAYSLTWNSRLEAIRATGDLWRMFPWTGSGLGTFRDAFPRVQPESLEGLWMHGHSDWVELGATAGWLGCGLVAFGLLTLLWTLRRGLLDGLRTEDRVAPLAAVGALVAVLAHEAVDFGLTMPANAAVLVAICGAAAAVRRAPAGPHQLGEEGTLARLRQREELDSAGN
jgi:hypothetical protein